MMWMTDEECDKLIELCGWHLGICKLADCIIDSCDIMRRDDGYEWKTIYNVYKVFMS